MLSDGLPHLAASSFQRPFQNHEAGATRASAHSETRSGPAAESFPSNRIESRCETGAETTVPAGPRRATQQGEYDRLS